MLPYFCFDMKLYQIVIYRRNVTFTVLFSFSNRKFILNGWQFALRVRDAAEHLGGLIEMRMELVL